MSNSEVILGLHTSPKVTFKWTSCETKRHCFLFFFFWYWINWRFFQVVYLLDQRGSASFVCIRLSFILKHTYKYTYIFSADTLEMRFQFHKTPKVVIKAFAYQIPHLPLARFLHEVARVSSLSLYSCSTWCGACICHILPGILNIYLLKYPSNNTLNPLRTGSFF